MVIRNLFQRTYVRCRREVHMHAYALELQACMHPFGSYSNAQFWPAAFAVMRHVTGCSTETIRARELGASHIMWRTTLALYKSILRKVLAH